MHGYASTNHNALRSDEMRSVEIRSDEVMLDSWSEHGFTVLYCIRWYFIIRFPEQCSLALSIQHLHYVDVDELVYCQSDGSSTVVCSAMLHWDNSQVTCRCFGIPRWWIN